MVRRLGHILIDEGLIRAEQRELALRNQTLFGGRIGTNLVELGALELDALALALSRQRGFPAALQKHFDAIQEEAIALIPAHLTKKHLAIPLGFTSRTHQTLAVAFTDPSKFAVREFHLAAGARVVPVIAPELRILMYLEKLYGIPSAKRYGAPGRGPPNAQDRLGPSGSHNDLQLLDASHARERPATSTSVENSQSFFDMSRPDLSAPLSGSTPVLPLTEIAPVREVAVPVSRGSAPHPPIAEPQLDGAAPPSQKPAPKALTVAQAVDVISVAAGRDDIGDALVGYLRSIFDCGLVLIAQYEVAMGWKGFAPTVEDNVIHSLAIPLAAPSLLKSVYEKQSIFLGPPAPEGAMLDARLWKLLGVPPPREILVAPISIRERVVNLIYGHPSNGGPVPGRAAADLDTLCRAAAAGYIRLIQASKNKAKD